ncbi:polyprotein [Phytophthora megakarya]|uniref:Polyprotein n=1 Tax=Phytophthora megakarya TaxID=4795 RepID=A0A225VI30_9STRA|nr:polyprotein [Phytophthora megakarya]
MKGKYTVASVMATELLGFRELLGELNVILEVPMALRVDYQAALKQLDGEGASAKAKHIDTTYTKRGILKPEYFKGEKIPADLLTKALEAPRLTTLRSKIELH